MVAGLARLEVGAQQAREVEPAHQLLHRGELRGERPGGISFRAERRHPAVQHELERASLRARLGGEVADELAVGGEPLTLPALETTLGG